MKGTLNKIHYFSIYKNHALLRFSQCKGVRWELSSRKIQSVFEKSYEPNNILFVKCFHKGQNEIFYNSFTENIETSWTMKKLRLKAWKIRYINELQDRRFGRFFFLFFTGHYCEWDFWV